MWIPSNEKHIGVSKDFQAKNWLNIQILTSCLQKMRGAKGSPLEKLSCSLMVNWWRQPAFLRCVWSSFHARIKEAQSSNTVFWMLLFRMNQFISKGVNTHPKLLGVFSCWSNGWKQQVGARRRCLSTLSLTSRSFPSFGCPWKRRTKEKQNKQKHVDAGI